MPARPFLRRVVLTALLGAALLVPAASARREQADLALVLAVDVSESIDAARFTLQMEGIAAAFEQPEVQASMLSGPHHATLIALVQWSNRPSLSVPWTVLTSAGDVARLAERVRRLGRADKGFTCMSAALRSIADKLLTQLPVEATRIVVDVSGDGRDNCNLPETVDEVRDELASSGIAVNGLPILEGSEATTLEGWYRDHVIGGPNAFLIPAAGFEDFGRAMRRKFVTEISGDPCRGCMRPQRPRLGLADAGRLSPRLD